MYLSGLVSITFRQLDPKAIIQLCKDNQLRAVEWGGDVHVPHGDEGIAREVGELSRDAGLHLPNYGSYYRLDKSEDEGLSFTDVLKSAKALGVADIRVWAGALSWADASREKREAIREDLRRIASMAAEQDIGICLEYHAKTLTDHPDGAAFLLEGTPDFKVRTLWQPPNGAALEEAEASLLPILPRLSHLHVFHWWPTNKERHPLADGANRWRRYLDLARPDVHFVGPRFLLLEFVKDNDPANLEGDAATLNSLIG